MIILITQLGGGLVIWRKNVAVRYSQLAGFLGSIVVVLGILMDIYRKEMWI